VEYAARNPQAAGCTLVMLTVPDDEALAFWAQKLEWSGVEVTRFREPDLGGALTAIAASDPGLARRLARLHLLLRGEVMNGGREHVLAAEQGGSTEAGS
jgi:hypothetical protein